MILISLILISFLGAIEETRELIKGGYWLAEDYKFPQWGEDWTGWKRKFNSQHFVFGAFMLIVFSMMIFIKLTWWQVPIA